MPMNVPSHLGGHVAHGGGQPMPFPGGFRHGVQQQQQQQQQQSGQAHNRLQPPRGGGGGPRGTPPQGPHGYAASPTMGPTLPPQQVRCGPRPDAVRPGGRALARDALWHAFVVC